MDIRIKKEMSADYRQIEEPARFPSSYIFQLTKPGIRNPVCTLIRAKAGVCVYRVKSEGKRLILKVFEKEEDTREIQNYLILSELGIPTLPLLGYTENAILLPDVEASDDYRLGVENDMGDPRAARAIAKWYRALHEKGSAYLSGKEISMYDESDVITPENMKLVAEKTGTVGNALWQILRTHYSEIRSRIDSLPRTLTYNDFYRTNLIISKDQKTAFMFDYNLLGKGIAYGDIRNVTGSLSREAAEAFLEEYGDHISGEEKRADAFLAPLVTLFGACSRDSFPSWAEPSLEELKSGGILRHLREWTGLGAAGA